MKAEDVLPRYREVLAAGDLYAGVKILAELPESERRRIPLLLLESLTNSVQSSS